MINWMLLPYRRYAEFTGRSRRREYWSFILFYVLVFLVLNVFFGTNDWTRSPTGFGYNSALMGGGGMIGALFALASFIPALAVGVRRLHDQDRSGWLLLLGLIPFFGGFALIVLMFLSGTNGGNRYGPDPKQPGDAAVFS